MAVTISFVRQNSATNSGSWTAEAGKYYLVCWRNGNGTTNYPSGISNTAGTISFSLLGRTGAGTGTSPNVGVYGGVCTAGGTGVTTLNVGNTSNFATSVFEVVGFRDAGPVEQVAVNQGTADTSLSVTFPTAPRSDSAMFWFDGIASSSAHTVGAGMTLLNNGNNNESYAAWRNTGASPLSVTVAASRAWGAVAIEFAAIRDVITGPRLPTTASTTGGSTPWTNINNLYAEDGQYAYTVPVATASSNTYLDVKGYGFSIPSVGTISRVTVGLVAKSLTGGLVHLESVQLLKAGSPVGTAITPDTYISTGSMQTYEFTGPSLWGTTLTPSDVNNSGFGFRYRFIGYGDLQVTGNALPSVASSSGGTVAWTNPSNVTTTASTYATQVPATAATSNAYLIARDFGFNLPSDSTVISVSGSLTAAQSATGNGNAQLAEVYATLNGSSIVAGNMLSLQTYPTSLTAIGFSRTSPGWTYTDVNSANFGVMIRNQATVGSASTGNVLAGDGAQSGAQAVQWVNPNNITTAGATYAQITAPGSAANTDVYRRLEATAFGLSVPSDATVLGIAFTVGQFRTGGSAGQMVITCYGMKNTTVSSNNSSAGNMGATLSNYTYGGTNQLWGFSWTPAEVNSQLGCHLRILGTTANTNRVANVQYVYANVTYTTPNTREVQCQTVRMEVAYTIPNSGEIQVDTAEVSVGVEGIISLGSTVSQTQAFNASVSRLRGLKAAIDEVFSITADLYVKPPYVEFASIISETLSIAARLGRHTRVSSSISFQEDLTARLKRASSLSTLISETEAVIVALRRLSNLGANITENEAIAVGALRVMRSMKTQIEETMTLDVFLNKYRSFVSTIAEQFALNTGLIQRNRHFASSIAELMTLEAQLSRLMTIVGNVDLKEELEAEMRIGRGLITQISEQMAIDVTLFRDVQFVAEIEEYLNVSAFLNKFKAFVTSIEQQLALTTDFFVERSFAARIDSIQELNTQIRIARSLASSVLQQWEVASEFVVGRSFKVEVEEVTFLNATLARLSALSAQIEELAELETTVVIERAMSSAIEQYEEVSAAMARARLFGTVVVQNETLVADMSVLREMVTNLFEVQGFNTGRIQRARQYVTDIAQTLDVNVKLTISFTDTYTLTITANWAEAVVLPDGTVDYQDRSLTWDVTRRPDVSVVDFPVGMEPIVIDITPFTVPH